MMPKASTARSESGLGSPPAQVLEQRRHDRHALQLPGILRIEAMRGGVYVITVLDVSKSGLRINCPTTVPNGSRVEVKCQGAKITGRVKYAREVGGQEFHLGVEADGANEAAMLPDGELDLTLLFRLSGRTH